MFPGGLAVPSLAQLLASAIAPSTVAGLPPGMPGQAPSIATPPFLGGPAITAPSSSAAPVQMAAARAPAPPRATSKAPQVSTTPRPADTWPPAWQQPVYPSVPLPGAIATSRPSMQTPGINPNAPTPQAPVMNGPPGPVVLGGPGGQPLPVPGPSASTPGVGTQIWNRLSDPRMSAFLMGAGQRMLMPRQLGESGMMQIGQGLIQGYGGMSALAEAQHKRQMEEAEARRKAYETQTQGYKDVATGTEAIERGGLYHAQAGEVPKKSQREQEQQDFEQRMGDLKYKLDVKKLQTDTKYNEDKLTFDYEKLDADRQHWKDETATANNRVAVEQAKVDEDKRHNKSEEEIQAGNARVNSAKADAEIAKLRAEAADIMSRPGQVSKADIERLRTHRQILSNVLQNQLPGGLETPGAMQNVLKQADDLINFTEGFIVKKQAELAGQAGGQATGTGQNYTPSMPPRPATPGYTPRPEYGPNTPLTPQGQVAPQAPPASTQQQPQASTANQPFTVNIGGQLRQFANRAKYDEFVKAAAQQGYTIQTQE